MRRLIGIVILVVGAHGLVYAVDGLERKRWNVVLVTLDSLSTDFIGAYGNPHAETPHLDRLAAESMVYTDAHTTTPWTSPAMISMLTGTYPPVHGVMNRGDRPPEMLPDLAEIFQQAGYATPRLAYLADVPNYDNLDFEALPASYGELGWREKLWRFLEGHDSAEQPFFIWFHEKICHLPYKPDDLRHLRALTESPVETRTPQIEELLQRSLAIKGEFDLSSSEQSALRALYAAQVRAQDVFIGQLMRRLEETGLANDTVLIVTADHGEELYERGAIGHASGNLAGHVQREVTRIPLFVRLPGGAVSAISDALVDVTDIAPTLLEQCDLKPPATMQGRSFRRSFRRPDDDGKPMVFGVTPPGGWNNLPEWEHHRVFFVRSKEGLVTWRHAPDQPAEVRYYETYLDPAEVHGMALEDGFGPAAKLEDRLIRWRTRCRLHRTEHGITNPPPGRKGDPEWYGLLRGRVASLEGKYEEARTVWEETLTLAEERNNEGIANLLRHALATYIPDDSPEMPE